MHDEPKLDFAVLVSSHALGAARTDSDWDIALIHTWLLAPQAFELVPVAEVAIGADLG